MAILLSLYPVIAYIKHTARQLIIYTHRMLLKAVVVKIYTSLYPIYIECIIAGYKVYKQWEYLLVKTLLMLYTRLMAG